MAAAAAERHQARRLEDLFGSGRTPRLRPAEAQGGRQGGTVLVHNDPEAAIGVARELKQAMQAAVMHHMEAGAWKVCAFSKKTLAPTVKPLRDACENSIKCGWKRLTKQQKSGLCDDKSEQTVMEKGDGTMVAVEFQCRGRSNGLMSIDALTQIFQREVMPSTLEVGSPASAQRLSRGQFI